MWSDFNLKVCVVSLVSVYLDPIIHPHVWLTIMLLQYPTYQWKRNDEFSLQLPRLQQQPVLVCATTFLNSTNSCCKASVINSWRTPIFIRSASLLHLTQESCLNFLWADSSLISSLLHNLYWFLFSCAFSSSNPFINLAINLSQQALYSPGSSIFLSLIFLKIVHQLKSLSHSWQFS